MSNQEASATGRYTDMSVHLQCMMSKQRRGKLSKSILTSQTYLSFRVRRLNVSINITAAPGIILPDGQPTEVGLTGLHTSLQPPIVLEAKHRSTDVKDEPNTLGSMPVV